jgi:hypothetical protein
VEVIGDLRDVLVLRMKGGPRVMTSRAGSQPPG